MRKRPSEWSALREKISKKRTLQELLQNSILVSLCVVFKKTSVIVENICLFIRRFLQFEVVRVYNRKDANHWVRDSIFLCHMMDFPTTELPVHRLVFTNFGQICENYFRKNVIICEIPVKFIMHSTIWLK